MTASKFELQRAQELSRTQREDGKQDAWNRHAQVASEARVTTEEYGPDDERQRVGREERELLPRHNVPRIQNSSAKGRGEGKLAEKWSDETLTPQISEEKTTQKIK